LRIRSWIKDSGLSVDIAIMPAPEAYAEAIDPPSWT
jgi:hypothetical protein